MSLRFLQCIILELHIINACLTTARIITVCYHRVNSKKSLFANLNAKCKIYAPMISELL